MGKIIKSSRYAYLQCGWIFNPWKLMAWRKWVLKYQEIEEDFFIDQKITTDLFILSSKKVSKMSPSLLFPILTFSAFLWQGDQKYTSVIKGKVEGCWGYCLQFEGTNFACKSLYVQTFLWSLEFAIFKISRAWHYLASDHL